MKDDAAKIIVYILGVSIAVGLLVMLGHYLIVGQAYSPEYCFESNKEAGFYPYVSPKRELDEGF